MDPDMALGSSPGLEDTMTLGDNTGHSNQLGPGVAAQKPT